jgi:hypothetical protein
VDPVGNYDEEGKHQCAGCAITRMPPCRSGWKQFARRWKNKVAKYLVDGGKPIPGELISIGGGPLLEVVQVQQPDAHMDVAVAIYGTDLRALQLVWPDDRGHRPWDPAFFNEYARQPVLGVRVGLT